MTRETIDEVAAILDREAAPHDEWAQRYALAGQAARAAAHRQTADALRLARRLFLQHWVAQEPRMVPAYLMVGAGA